MNAMHRDVFDINDYYREVNRLESLAHHLPVDRDDARVEAWAEYLQHVAKNVGVIVESGDEAMIEDTLDRLEYGTSALREITGHERE